MTADHVRETATPVDGGLVGDCSCGAEYFVTPDPGEFEYDALERAHAEHVAKVGDRS